MSLDIYLSKKKWKDMEKLVEGAFELAIKKNSNHSFLQKMLGTSNHSFLQKMLVSDCFL